MNRRYLRHNYDTDVIAFGFDDPSTLGDIYISVYQARKQAAELGHGLLEELLTLAVHGTLHLVGYRDATPAQRKRMFSRQERILSRTCRAQARQITRPKRVKAAL